MKFFFKNWSTTIFFVLFLATMLWKMILNTDDPNCETDWEAMTNWTCKDKQDEPDAGCLCPCPCVEENQ